MLNRNAKRWVKALRSGEYKQAKSDLRVDDSFCCLGVACDLYRQEHPEAHWGDGTRPAFMVNDTDIGTTALLPDEVQNWLDLNDNGGKYHINTLTGLNDTGFTFEEIADVIESEPYGLFTAFTA